jgi:hypothetical protein
MKVEPIPSAALHRSAVAGDARADRSECESAGAGDARAATSKGSALRPPAAGPDTRHHRRPRSAPDVQTSDTKRPTRANRFKTHWTPIPQHESASGGACVVPKRLVAGARRKSQTNICY